MGTCVCVCMHADVFVCVCACTFVCVCVYVCTFACMYLHTASRQIILAKFCFVSETDHPIQILYFHFYQVCLFAYVFLVFTQPMFLFDTAERCLLDRGGKGQETELEGRPNGQIIPQEGTWGQLLSERERGGGGENASSSVFIKIIIIIIMIIAMIYIA